MAAGLAEAVGALADDPGRARARGVAGRAFVSREYNRTSWARRYAELLEVKFRDGAR